MDLAVPPQLFSFSLAVLGVFNPWEAAYFPSQNTVLLLSLSSVLWRWFWGLLHRSLFDTLQPHWWGLCYPAWPCPRAAQGSGAELTQPKVRGNPQRCSSMCVKKPTNLFFLSASCSKGRGAERDKGD